MFLPETQVILMLPLALEALVILYSATSIGSVVPTRGNLSPLNSNQVESIKPKFLVTPALWRHRSPRKA